MGLEGWGDAELLKHPRVELSLIPQDLHEKQQAEHDRGWHL